MSERSIRVRQKMDLLSRNSSSAIMFGLLLMIAGLWCYAVGRPAGILFAGICALVLMAARARSNNYVASGMLFAVLAWPVQPFEVTFINAAGGPRVLDRCGSKGAGTEFTVRDSADAACMETPASANDFAAGYYLVW